MFTRVRSDADDFHRESTIATADVDSCWARLTEPRIAKSRGIDLFCNGNWPSGTAGSEETVSNMKVLSFMDKGWARSLCFSRDTRDWREQPTRRAHLARGTAKFSTAQLFP
jgi:hypothetical protein